MSFVCLDGEFFPGNEKLIDAQNRCFKWGDGVFETMKVHNGKLLLAELHFERLYVSLRLLGIKGEQLDAGSLIHSILHLCQRNNCFDLARVRMSVYRNNDNTAGYLIEAKSLSHDVLKWNEKGQVAGLYPYARKSTDAFSNLKSSSFLSYSMAALYAQEHGLDDVIVLNTAHRVADSSRANLFIIKKGNLITPALHEGCINGVMRRYLIEELKKKDIAVFQSEISEEELLDADEVFLSNAIQGLRWVRTFKGKSFLQQQTSEIYHDVVAPLFAPPMHR